MITGKSSSSSERLKVFGLSLQRFWVASNMSQLDVTKNKQQILDTWKDVVDNKTPTDWWVPVDPVAYLDLNVGSKG